MNVFISVVSHRHTDIITSLDVLSTLASEFQVVVKENSSDLSLADYCFKNGIIFINNDQGIGFGSNNNKVFTYCKDSLGMKSNDIFIVLNPDVIIDVISVRKVVKKIILGTKLLGINLFKDDNLSVYDNSVRKYPTLYTFVKSVLGLGNNTIVDKDKIAEDVEVDWFAGSFMAFESAHYETLSGFDEGYFMYCEDIDICHRSKLHGSAPIYTPNIKAIHKAQHSSRNYLSKHFFWHVRSSFRFLIRKQFRVGF